MSKKTWYSSPLNLFWKEMYPTQKSITPYFSDEQIYLALKYTIAHARPNADDVDTREGYLIGLEMWWQDCSKNFLHIFFQEKELRNFLQEMPLPDLSGVSKYLHQNGEIKTVAYIKNQSQVNCTMFNFGLHIPYETNGYAFQFSVFETGAVELAFFYGKTFGALNDKMYLDMHNLKDSKSQNLCKVFRLAVNTLAYMQCFPECVKEGVPKITIDRDEKRTDKNIILGISDKVSDINALGKKSTPHFRKGHFRVLRSDFYKNRKGDLIFIHETMVNGKAKTLYTADNLQDFENYIEE